MLILKVIISLGIAICLPMVLYKLVTGFWSMEYSEQKTLARYRNCKRCGREKTKDYDIDGYPGYCQVCATRGNFERESG